MMYDREEYRRCRNTLHEWAYTEGKRKEVTLKRFAQQHPQFSRGAVTQAFYWLRNLRENDKPAFICRRSGRYQLWTLRRAYSPNIADSLLVRVRKVNTEISVAIRDLEHSAGNNSISILQSEARASYRLQAMLGGAQIVIQQAETLLVGKAIEEDEEE